MKPKLHTKSYNKAIGDVIFQLESYLEVVEESDIPNSSVVKQTMLDTIKLIINRVNSL